MENYEVGNESISRGGSKAVVPVTVEPEQAQEMSFLDHLEALRWHLIRAFGSIFIFTIVAFFSKDLLFGTILLGPSKLDFWTYRALCDLAETMSTPLLCIDKLPFSIQSRTLTGQFAVHISASLVVGVVCAFPYAFWEIWRFVRPGLYTTEQSASRGATLGVSFLFFLGVFFGYFILTPLSINFLANYQVDPSIINEVDIVSYINTVVMLTLACAIMFQLPMVIYFLSKVGIVTPEYMRTYRRHAVTIILFIAAVITPPDVFSQVLVALPVYFLYEASIGISAYVQRQRQKAALKAESEQ